MMSQESAITFWGVCSIITTIFTILTLAAYIVNRRRDEKKKREGIYISRLQALLAYIIVFIPGFPIIRYFCRSMALRLTPIRRVSASL